MKRKTSAPTKKNGAVTVKKSVPQDASSKSTQLRELHELAQELIREQEEQRRIISRELHDNIAQTLSAATNRLALTGEKARTQTVIRELDQLRHDLVTTLEEVRRFARDLRPPTMDSFCLCQALEKHLTEMRDRVPFELDFQCQVASHELLDNESSTHLFRIAQEALHNVEKHSRASQAWVRLQIDRSQLHLEIGDNGCSFHPDRVAEAQKNGHLGLLTMRERAEMLGGDLQIRGTPGNGTTVQTTIPLNGQPGRKTDKKP